MKIKRVSAVSLCLFLAGFANGQDRCEAVLRYSAAAVGSIESSERTDSLYRYVFCLDEEQFRSATSNADIGIPIPLAEAVANFKAGMTSSERETWKRNYCTTQESRLSTAHLVRMVEGIDPRAISAWQACTQRGFSAALTNFGTSEFSVTFEHQAGLGCNAVDVSRPVFNRTKFSLLGPEWPAAGLRVNSGTPRQGLFQHRRRGDGTIQFTYQCTNGSRAAGEVSLLVPDSPPPMDSKLIPLAVDVYSGDRAEPFRGPANVFVGGTGTPIKGISVRTAYKIPNLDITYDAQAATPSQGGRLASKRNGDVLWCDSATGPMANCSLASLRFGLSGTAQNDYRLRVQAKTFRPCSSTVSPIAGDRTEVGNGDGSQQLDVCGGPRYPTDAVMIWLEKK